MNRHLFLTPVMLLLTAILFPPASTISFAESIEAEKLEKDPVPKAEKKVVAWEGSVVMAGDGVLVMKRNGKQLTVKVNNQTTIQKDKKPAQLADLRMRDFVHVKLVGDAVDPVAATITARSVQ